MGQRDGGSGLRMSLPRSRSGSSSAIDVAGVGLIVERWDSLNPGLGLSVDIFEKRDGVFL